MNETRPRIALALGAGGRRGLALAAVLGRLHREGIPLDAIVGCSVGGIVGALYAAAGMEPGAMIAAALRLGPGALFGLAAARWGARGRGRAVSPGRAPLAETLGRLESASFDKLHFGVRRFGVLALELISRRILLLEGGPGRPVPLPVARAVAATSAIPLIFPPVAARIAGRTGWLVDPGWFTAVPVERAFAPPIEARHVIAVDLSLLSCPRQARRRYWDDLAAACGDRLLTLRPRVRGCGTMIGRPGDADRLVAAGEEAVGEDALRTIRSWIATPPA